STARWPSFVRSVHRALIAAVSVEHDRAWPAKRSPCCCGGTMAPTLLRPSVRKSGQVWVRTSGAAAGRTDRHQNPRKSGPISLPAALSARGYVRRSGLTLGPPGSSLALGSSGFSALGGDGRGERQKSRAGARRSRL